MKQIEVSEQNGVSEGGLCYWIVTELEGQARQVNWRGASMAEARKALVAQQQALQHHPRRWAVRIEQSPPPVVPVSKLSALKQWLRGGRG